MVCLFPHPALGPALCLPLTSSHSQRKLVPQLRLSETFVKPFPFLQVPAEIGLGSFFQVVLVRVLSSFLCCDNKYMFFLLLICFPYAILLYILHTRLFRYNTIVVFFLHPF